VATEIEHKFLVIRAQLPRQLGRGAKIEQGYLSLLPTVRVRLASVGKRLRAWLTIKGPNSPRRRGTRAPLRRAEFEDAIPIDEARALLALGADRTLTKIRYRIGGWEVDEFTGRHRGLWLAEYELKSAQDALPPRPMWVGREVTGDPRFSNARLAQMKRPPLLT
jgi:adenylate cyclase